jgi:hypothetical protein
MALAYSAFNVSTSDRTHAPHFREHLGIRRGDRTFLFSEHLRIGTLLGALMWVTIDHRIAQYSIEPSDDRLVVANPRRLRDAANERILEDVFGCLARLDPALQKGQKSPMVLRQDCGDVVGDVAGFMRISNQVNRMTNAQPLQAAKQWQRASLLRRAISPLITPIQSPAEI